MGKKIRLRHRQFEGLVFGPNSETAIRFGIRGGFAPGEALVDEDDPLVARLLAEDPDVEIVRADGPRQVFVCPDHPDQEFKTKGSLLAHMKAKGHAKPAADAPDAKVADAPDAGDEPDAEPDAADE